MEFSDVIRSQCKKWHYSESYKQYWLNHPYCEVCRAEGITRYSAAPHHIQTRGAGGKDNADNLIALCTKHHTESHQLGNKLFMARHPATVTAKLLRKIL